MQRKSNCSLDFIELTPTRKLPFGYNVATEITANASAFPALPVAANDLKKATDEFTSAISAAETGDHMAKAALLNAEKKWDNLFRQTANYITTVANGNEEIIRMGGFTPTKNETQPPHAPGVCKNVEIMAERGKGTITAGCDADINSKAFVYVAATDKVQVKQDGNMLVFTLGDETVYVEADTHRKTMLHNLEGGTKLNVSMMALNSAGCGPLSNPETVIPQ